MSTSTVPVIAIDGPSASGKGTVAQKVAAALGFHFLDSGALYRLVALASVNHGIDLDNTLEVAAIARNLDANFQEQQIWMSGREVTDAIRAEAVSAAASKVAAAAPVREALLERQRDFRRAPGLVADGRDMGSVVFPDATLKIFLTADAAERARRRYKQLMEKGMSANMDALLEEIRERDARDMARAAAPLLKCADAVELDTTRLSVGEAEDRVLKLYQQRAT